MGRTPCCAKVGVNRGAWCAQEDQLLASYINANGEGNWKTLPLKAGLNRCGKSCRLRWINYLKPGIKRGGFTEDEDDLLIKLHNLLGNRWSLIAGRLPGRTDNEIKNYWNTTVSKKVKNSSRLDENSGNPPPNQLINSIVESRSRSKVDDHHKQLQHSTNDHHQNHGAHLVHYTKAYRCTKVVLPPRLDTSTSPLLVSSYEAGEHIPSNDMMLDDNDRNGGIVKNEDMVGISCPDWTIGEDGGSSSHMFSFSPSGVEDCDLLLSKDFEAMPNWLALQKMASFLDLEVDEWK